MLGCSFPHETSLSKDGHASLRSLHGHNRVSRVAVQADVPALGFDKRLVTRGVKGGCNQSH